MRGREAPRGPRGAQLWWCEPGCSRHREPCCQASPVNQNLKDAARLPGQGEDVTIRNWSRGTDHFLCWHQCFVQKQQKNLVTHKCSPSALGAQGWHAPCARNFLNYTSRISNHNISQYIIVNSVQTAKYNGFLKIFKKVLWYLSYSNGHITIIYRR